MIIMWVTHRWEVEEVLFYFLYMWLACEKYLYICDPVLEYDIQKSGVGIIDCKILYKFSQ